MTTLAFSEDGRCICAVSVPVEAVYFTDSAKVIEVDAAITANEVWYDFEKDAIAFRKPAQYTLQKNQILGLPTGTMAHAQGETVAVDDGSLEIEVEYDQIVTVLLVSPKFLDTVVEVHCETAR